MLDLLVAEGYSVTGFVRRQEHAEQIKASGAAVVMGDLNDKKAITEQTAKHDITLHTGKLQAIVVPRARSTDMSNSNCRPSSKCRGRV